MDLMDRRKGRDRVDVMTSGKNQSSGEACIGGIGAIQHGGASASGTAGYPGESIVAAIQAAGAIVRRALARYRRYRRERDTYDALRQLDDHTLRDLGLHRSEISSISAESMGEAEHTRVRARRIGRADPHWRD
jgi:uncharacterized protein YjiS (DUF1127 family)